MRYCLIILMFGSVLSYAADSFAPVDAKERIKPIGQVRTSTSAAKQQAVAAPKAAAVEVSKGEQVYGQYCQVCHQGGLAGAPKFRDEADWKPRLAKMDVDALTASAIKGINAMPARGTCTDCSDEDIKAAVEYMLPKS